MKFITTSILLLLATTTNGRDTEVELDGEVNANVGPVIEVDTAAVDLVDEVFDNFVDLDAVESLRLPPALTLERLVERLEEQLAGIDRPLMIERRWMLIENFYRYRDGRRELIFLDSVKTNLKQVYLLNRKLANKGEVNDVQVLGAHNTYLRSELEYLATERTIRDAILTIVRLANLELDIDPKDGSRGRLQEEKTNPIADR